MLFSVRGSMVRTHTGIGWPRPVDTLESSWMGGGELLLYSTIGFRHWYYCASMSQYSLRAAFISFMQVFSCVRHNRFCQPCVSTPYHVKLTSSSLNHPTDHQVRLAFDLTSKTLYASPLECPNQIRTLTVRAF